MDHNHDVRAGLEREAIAGFLIASVTLIDLVLVYLNPLKALSNRNRIIPAPVIDQNNQIHQLLLAHFGVRLAQCPGGVVSRHDDDYLFIAIHFQTPDIRTCSADENRAGGWATSSIVRPAGLSCDCSGRNLPATHLWAWARIVRDRKKGS